MHTDAQMHARTLAQTNRTIPIPVMLTWRPLWSTNEPSTYPCRPYNNRTQDVFKRSSLVPLNYSKHRCIHVFDSNSPFISEAGIYVHAQRLRQIFFNAKNSAKIENLTATWTTVDKTDNSSDDNFEHALFALAQYVQDSYTRIQTLGYFVSE